MDLSLANASPEYAAILAKIYTLQARQVELSEVTANPFLKVHHPSIERPSRPGAHQQTPTRAAAARTE
jgi:hypothetical protein